MQKRYSILSLLLATAMFTSPGIHTIHVTKINGEDLSLGTFYGKKMLIVVLPVTKTAGDSAFLRNLDSVSQEYAQQLAVIAVPSVEDGYEAEDLAELQAYYGAMLPSHVAVTRGMFTRKSSGVQQHPLFHWLTHKEENVRFDLEVEGAGQRYFVNGQGKLYAVASPQVRLSARLMQQMMQQ